MGCDGGTIPRRDELVRLKKKPEQKDKHMERMAKWLHCWITQEPLREPIVACELGRLYNKESVLEYLLDKSSTDAADHIRSLKDVRQLTLTENPAFEDKHKVDKGDAYVDTHIAPYICPVTGIEMNGLYKFCYLWTCGCVMSQKAIKEVKSAVCHKCGVPFNYDDIILNGSDEDVKQLRTRMEEKRARAKAEKKAKKAHKRKLEEPSSSTSTATNGDKTESTEKNKETDSKLTNGSTSSTAVSSTATASKKLTNGSTSSKVANGKAANGHANKEFDPKKSKVYQSLFLPKGDKGENSAHWVTYNPYYAMSK